MYRDLNLPKAFYSKASCRNHLYNLWLHRSCTFVAPRAFTGEPLYVQPSQDCEMFRCRYGEPTGSSRSFQIFRSSSLASDDKGSTEHQEAGSVLPESPSKNYAAFACDSEGSPEREVITGDRRIQFLIRPAKYI